MEAWTADGVPRRRTEVIEGHFSSGGGVDGDVGVVGSSRSSRRGEEEEMQEEDVSPGGISTGTGSSTALL